MDTLLYISFILTTVILIIIPGPNVLVIISSSAIHGSRSGLLTVMGTSSAMIIQLLIAAVGTTWIAESLVHGFVWLQWLGIVYLLYVGATHIHKTLTGSGSPSNRVANHHDNSVAATHLFIRGFVVSLTNPKTILFFSAFLPQFVAENHSYSLQIVILSSTFLILAMLIDSLYALLAGNVKGYFQNDQIYKLQHGVSGCLLMGAGIWLALTRKG